jgi:hypothetical protein
MEVNGQHGHFTHEGGGEPTPKTERPQNRSERTGEKKNLLSMPEIESQIVQPTAYSPYKLSYYRSHQCEKQHFIT